MVKRSNNFQVEKKDKIVIWKYSNPPKNLLTAEAAHELRQFVEEFDRDQSLHVGILTSDLKGIFIQHFDVSQILDWADPGRKISYEEIANNLAPLRNGISGYTKKPIICAINGPAEGGGCELALGCDLRFLAKTAYFGQPEVNAGIMPGGGGTQRLARLINVPKALELCLTGRRMYPAEADAYGLVVKVCDPEDLMPSVLEFASELSKKSIVSLQNIKDAIYSGNSLSIRDGLTFEGKLFVDSIRKKDAIQIMRYYVENGQDPNKFNQPQ